MGSLFCLYFANGRKTVKQYRVIRASKFSDTNYMTTCAKTFDTAEEAVDFVKNQQTKFPTSTFVNGMLKRRVDILSTQTHNGVKYTTIKEGTVYVSILLLEDDRMPMPFNLA